MEKLKTLANLSVSNEEYLLNRLGESHARQRLGIESESPIRVFGGGLNFFHPENWFLSHRFIKMVLKITGMYERGRKNALSIQTRINPVQLDRLPKSFHQYRILHLSDLHVDLDEQITQKIIAQIQSVKNYDICVLTGDYRAQTSGSIHKCMTGMKQIVAAIDAPIFGVLGNHDSITMLPGLEAMGIQMLVNENIRLSRENEHIYLAGIDDAHYYRVDNIEKAVQNVPLQSCSVLLSHTPEVFKQATHAGFDLFLCGHTHGGQICLPGGIALTLDSNCPRFLGAEDWQYQKMKGYTSVGAGASIINVRFNCPPSITVHQLISV